MKQKFTINSKDKAYMNSIGKSLHRKPNLVKVAQAKTVALQNKLSQSNAKVAKVGQGRSHRSNKIYNH